MEQNLRFGLVLGHLLVLKPAQSKLKYLTLRVVFLCFHGENIVGCSNRDISSRDLFVMTLCAATQSLFLYVLVLLYNGRLFFYSVGILP